MKYDKDKYVRIKFDNNSSKQEIEQNKNTENQKLRS